MGWIWFITGAIFTLLSIGGIWLISRWLSKKPDFELKQGVKVYTHLNIESKRTKKKEIEEYLAAYIHHLVAKNLFNENQLLEAIKKTHLFWKIQPYWNRATKAYDSGTCVGDHVIVGWNPYLERTALSHEYMHIFLGQIKGTADPDHKLRAYWAAGDSFSGPKS